MITRFGKTVRKLRVEKEITLREMASDLGFSSAFLSAVERGTKSIPRGLSNKIVMFYKLDQEQCEALQKAEVLSAGKVEVETEGLDEDTIDFAAAFARKASTLSPEQIAELRRIMEGD